MNFQRLYRDLDTTAVHLRDAGGSSKPRDVRRHLRLAKRRVDAMLKRVEKEVK